MSKEGFAKLFIAYIIIISVWLGLNNDSIAASIAAGGIVGIAFYVVTSPDSLLIFISVFSSSQKAVWKRALAGLNTVITFDILSFPRLSHSGMSSDPSLLASIDGFTAKWALANGISYGVFWAVFYVVLPILLTLLSAWLLGLVNLAKTLKR